MVHTFTSQDHHIALDVESGSVHLLDDIGLAVLGLVCEPMARDCPRDVTEALSKSFAPQIGRAHV